MKSHYDIKVTGKVQNVNFRKAAKEKADILGLKGFVRNEADGSVYIEVEDGKHELAEFVLWCDMGPNKSQVESILLQNGDIKNFTDFKILR